MQRSGTTLRRRITIAVVTVAVLAVVAAMSLVAVTSLLHGASIRSTAAVESVRLAEEVQRDILLHDRIVNTVERAHIRRGLLDRLNQARSRVSSPEQHTALVTADSAVIDYFAADDAIVRVAEDVAAKHATAFTALGALVEINIDVAQRAAATAEKYDRLADLIGFGVASAVVLASGAILWWLNARAFRPLFGLAHAMRRFGDGSADERADETGPEELAGMARQFNAMATAIARQRRERQTFIASVAHDLRTPLSVLQMSTDLMKASDAPLAPEKAAKVWASVRRQVGRLDRMIGDLLESASVEAGNVPLRIAAHDVRALAVEVVHHYEKTSTDHTFSLDLPDGPATLHCDAMRVEQILSNLVSNAIKYSPDGGVVALGLEVTNDAAIFTVRDEGIGMTAEDAVKSFEPFRRSATLRDHVAGSGLGLYVVRRLVEAHGGTVEVESTPGGGSTFTVWLPKTPRPPETPHPPEARSTDAPASTLPGEEMSRARV